jgi:hypothetical protein
MARSWSPVSRDEAEFERQFGSALVEGRRAGGSEPRAVAAFYDADARRVAVELQSGLAFAFPTARFAALDALSPREAAAVRFTASGDALHWEDADLHLPVSYLIAEVFGAFAAAESGRVGGRSRTPAKAAAARQNARRGGRPPTEARYEPEADRLRVDVRAGRLRRSLTVRVGGDYVVDPLNPAARRHRGRSGIVKSIRDPREGRIELRFHDTGRVAVVDARDLRPVDSDPPAAAA